MTTPKTYRVIEYVQERRSIIVKYSGDMILGDGLGCDEDVYEFIRDTMLTVENTRIVHDSILVEEATDIQDDEQTVDLDKWLEEQRK